MPEGDTIHTLAAVLRGELVAERLSGGRVREQPTLRLDGRLVTAVEPHGKHLFVALSARTPDDDALVLQSHLGLHGAWHRYRPGESWRQGRAAGRAALVAPARAAVVLETRERVYVCFGAREARVLESTAAAAFARARNLGPDATRAAPRTDELEERIVRFVPGAAPLVDLLLDQRVACGIGNVYTSELLFDLRLHPLDPVGSLDPATLGRLYARAHELLAANVGGGPRVVRSERDGRGGLAVYGRAGQPCFACSAPIEAERIGRGRRITSWCPSCQVRGAASRGTIARS